MRKTMYPESAHTADPTHQTDASLATSGLPNRMMS